jgi:16S rRNA U1498 N3-methylase RsmE
LITSENDELKRENEILKMELSLLKGKCHVQPSQDNRDHMVKKLKKGSTVTCVKLSQINLKTSYQKIDKTKIKKKAHLNVPTRKLIKQTSLEDKEAYLREDDLLAKKRVTI